MEIELSGKIKFVYGTSRSNFYKIKLIQEDGFEIDLVSRFQEIVENSEIGTPIGVSYYLSDNICSKDEAVESLLKKLYGVAEAGYDTQDIEYSEWTSDTEYNTTLTIGGHNLFQELIDEEGRFIIIIAKFTTNDNKTIL